MNVDEGAHLVKRDAFTLNAKGEPSVTQVQTLCGKTIKITEVSRVDKPNHGGCFDNIEKGKRPPHYWVVGGTRT